MLNCPYAVHVVKRRVAKRVMMLERFMKSSLPSLGILCGRRMLPSVQRTRNLN